MLARQRLDRLGVDQRQVAADTVVLVVAAAVGIAIALKADADDRANGVDSAHWRAGGSGDVYVLDDPNRRRLRCRRSLELARGRGRGLSAHGAKALGTQAGDWQKQRLGCDIPGEPAPLRARFRLAHRWFTACRVDAHEDRAIARSFRED